MLVFSWTQSNIATLPQRMTLLHVDTTAQLNASLCASETRSISHVQCEKYFDVSCVLGNWIDLFRIFFYKILFLGGKKKKTTCTKETYLYLHVSTSVDMEFLGKASQVRGGVSENVFTFSVNS